MSAGIYSVYRQPVKPRTKGLGESELYQRDSRTFELACKLRFNADGLEMPDIEHWASNRKAMAGSVQTDVTAPKGKFVFVLSGWLLNLKHNNKK